LRTEARRFVAAALMAASISGAASGNARAQSPLDPQPARNPLSDPIRFGPGPGSLEPSDFGAPGLMILGGKRRGGVIPRRKGIAQKTQDQNPFSGVSALALPTSRFGIDLNTAASSEGLLGETDDEGPPDGLTLDAAIERALAANIDLHALRQELPQAEADVLTAGLRNNPLLYGDTQFIPYGANNASRRPIGPIQYDIAITYPIDVSGKRHARVRVACQARQVVQAQYQDAVRRQIANVARAFLDLQSARRTYLATSRAVLDQKRIANEARQRPGNTGHDPERLHVELAKTLAAQEEANDALGDAREALGLLLNIPPDDAARLEPRGRIRVEPIQIPALDELIRIGLRFRPDLAAARLGIGRADAEIKLAQANTFEDVFLFYDPLSYQDNRPAHLPSGRSWDIGVTIPLPLFNRNQGNIARARSNAGQTRAELASLERRVISEVRLAEREHRSARLALERLDRDLLPNARADRRKAAAKFLAGEIDADEFLGHLDDEQETAKLHGESLVRLRRSMLDLNTVVGVRLQP
jgi:outer membrane protein, heavy metal efflux system